MRARKNRAVPSVPRCAAVIVAAGVSRRMGGRKRKPYLELRGKPILAWTAARLAKLDGVEQLVVVTRSEDRGQARRAIRQARLPRRIGVTYVEGGARRQDSVLNGIRAASPETEIVLIHDAARPFPPLEAMRAAVDAARRQGGAILAVPVRDTIKRQQEGDREAIVGATVPRAGLWQAQTPQVFRRALIRDLFEMLAHTTPDLEVTDDAAVCERFAQPVVLIESSSTNLKITRPEDLPIAEALLGERLV